jgi:hypothetical protein
MLYVISFFVVEIFDLTAYPVLYGRLPPEAIGLGSGRFEKLAAAKLSVFKMAVLREGFLGSTQGILITIIFAGYDGPRPDLSDKISHLERPLRVIPIRTFGIGLLVNLGIWVWVVGNM